MSGARPQIAGVAGSGGSHGGSAPVVQREEDDELEEMLSKQLPRSRFTGMLKSWGGAFTEPFKAAGTSRVVKHGGRMGAKTVKAGGVGLKTGSGNLTEAGGGRISGAKLGAEMLNPQSWAKGWEKGTKGEHVGTYSKPAKNLSPKISATRRPRPQAHAQSTAEYSGTKGTRGGLEAMEGRIAAAPGFFPGHAAGYLYDKGMWAPRAATRGIKSFFNKGGAVNADAETLNAKASNLPVQSGPMPQGDWLKGAVNNPNVPEPAKATSGHLADARTDAEEEKTSVSALPTGLADREMHRQQMNLYPSRGFSTASEKGKEKLFRKTDGDTPYDPDEIASIPPMQLDELFGGHEDDEEG
jgi:hypothetical protein